MLSRALARDAAVHRFPGRPDTVSLRSDSEHTHNRLISEAIIDRLVSCPPETVEQRSGGRYGCVPGCCGRSPGPWRHGWRQVLRLRITDIRHPRCPFDPGSSRSCTRRFRKYRIPEAVPEIDAWVIPIYKTDSVDLGARRLPEDPVKEGRPNEVFQAQHRLLVPGPLRRRGHLESAASESTREGSSAHAL